MSQTTKEMDDDWKDGTLILKIGKSYATETNETRRRSRKNFITFFYLIYNWHPLSTMNEEWRWRDGDWRNRRGTTNTRTNSPWPLIWKESKILEPHLIYFLYSFWNRHQRFDILKPTTKPICQNIPRFIFWYTNFAPGTGLDTSLESLKGKKG